MSKRLTKEQIEQIRARADAATEGPWATSPFYDGGMHLHTEEEGPLGEGFGYIGNPKNTHERDEEDAKFIAHARTDVPALIESHEALRKRVEWYEKFYLAMQKYHPGETDCIEETIGRLSV